MEKLLWKGRRVLVVGMARSGVAAAKLLAAQGAIPIVNDRQTAEQLGGALGDIQGKPYVWRLGEDPVTLLSDCDAVVISPGVPIQSPFILEAERMGIPVIGELELGFQLLKGTVAAITGTNGKTTTTTLVGEMCKNAGRLTYVAGNIGYPLTAVVGQSNPEDAVIVEVSSFQCESLETFCPQVAALLNITPDHLNRHGTMEVYMSCKRRIFERQLPDQTAVFNWDDPSCRKLAEGVPGRVAWFSRKEAVSYGAYVLQGELIVAMEEPARAICPIEEIKLPSAHLENALAATVMAVVLGVPLPVIRHTLRSFAGLEHRVETVRELGGVCYINDSKGTNVDATEKAIDAMRVPTVLILGGSDKGVDFAHLADCVRSHPLIEHVVLIGETAEKIGRALDAAGYKSYVHEGMNMENALNRCRQLAQPGWNVLLSPACASFDMFKDYEHRGGVFKQLVNQMQ